MSRRVRSWLVGILLWCLVAIFVGWPLHTYLVRGGFIE